MIRVNYYFCELYLALTISMILLKSIKVKNKGSKISKTRARVGWGKGNVSFSCGAFCEAKYKFRRRSKRGRGPAALLVQSRPTKKSFVHNFLFARAEFFLLKGKAIFLLGSALQRGRRAFRTARGQKIFYPVGSPSETPSGPPLEPFHFLPARSRFRRDLL